MGVRSFRRRSRVASLIATTQWSQCSGRNDECKSAALLLARRLEGECPHEPPSAVRKDGRRFHRGAPGGTSVARPRASRRLPLPTLRKPDDKCWRAASRSGSPSVSVSISIRTLNVQAGGVTASLILAESPPQSVDDGGAKTMRLLTKRGAESRERGRPRPQQRDLQKVTE